MAKKPKISDLTRDELKAKLKAKLADGTDGDKEWDEVMAELEKRPAPSNAKASGKDPQVEAAKKRSAAKKKPEPKETPKVKAKAKPAPKPEVKPEVKEKAKVARAKQTPAPAPPPSAPPAQRPSPAPARPRTPRAPRPAPPTGTGVNAGLSSPFTGGPGSNRQIALLNEITGSNLPPSAATNPIPPPSTPSTPAAPSRWGRIPPQLQALITKGRNAVNIVGASPVRSQVQSMLGKGAGMARSAAGFLGGKALPAVGAGLTAVELANYADPDGTSMLNPYNIGRMLGGQVMNAAPASVQQHAAPDLPLPAAPDHRRGVEFGAGAAERVDEEMPAMVAPTPNRTLLKRSPARKSAQQSLSMYAGMPKSLQEGIASADQQALAKLGMGQPEMDTPFGHEAPVDFGQAFAENFFSNPALVQQRQAMQPQPQLPAQGGNKGNALLKALLSLRGPY